MFSNSPAAQEFIDNAEELKNKFKQLKREVQKHLDRRKRLEAQTYRSPTDAALNEEVKRKEKERQAELEKPLKEKYTHYLKQLNALKDLARENKLLTPDQLQKLEKGIERAQEYDKLFYPDLQEKYEQRQRNIRQEVEYKIQPYKDKKIEIRNALYCREDNYEKAIDISAGFAVIGVGLAVILCIGVITLIDHLIQKVRQNQINSKIEQIKKEWKQEANSAKKHFRADYKLLVEPAQQSQQKLFRAGFFAEKVNRLLNEKETEPKYNPTPSISCKA